jgi:hypothetical protein
MGNAARWLALLIVTMIVLSMIGLVAYARGPQHHRGDEIGSHGTPVTTEAPR